jgi:ribosome biogenesis ATPase
VRQVFSRARASSPCIIFFDELDALVPRRDENLVRILPYKPPHMLTSPKSESSARVVNTLLTELDGLDARRGIFVLAATNRPDMIDPAMCRPGRLDKLLYVDLPTPDERAEIARTLIARRRVPLACESAAVEAAVRERADGYSGADLAAVVREAGVLALRRTLGALEDMDEGTGAGKVSVALEDFERALEKVNPSVSRAQRRKYEVLREKFSGMPMSGAVGRMSTKKDEPAERVM